MKKIVLIMLCVFMALGILRAEDARYNENINLPQNVEGGGDVSPQTGTLSLTYTDISLPGLNGLNFTATRSYSSVLANLYNMAANEDQSSVITPHTPEDWKYGLGAGWTFNWPFLFMDIDDQSALHTLRLFFGGGVYELEKEFSSDRDENNIKYYHVNDMRIYEDSSVMYTQEANDPTAGLLNNNNVASKYCLELKNGTKYYFSAAGNLMLIRTPSDPADVKVSEMWFYYRDHVLPTNAEEYRDYRDAAKIELIVDSVDRTIDLVYSDTSRLQEIAYQVIINDVTTDRTVKYFQEELDTYDVYEIDPDNKTRTNLGPQIPADDARFVLSAFENQAGQRNAYEYTVYRDAFSVNPAMGKAYNYFACLEKIYSIYTNTGEERYKSCTVYEYNKPGDLYTTYGRNFMNGYMNTYKITRKYLRNKFKTMMFDTNFEYYGNSYGKKLNEYWTVITQGNMEQRFVYSAEPIDTKNHLLQYKEISCNYGNFIERSDYAYDARKTLTTKSLYRDGMLKYMEHYVYDRYNDLIYSRDKSGLISETEYHERYHIPIYMLFRDIENGDGTTFDIEKRYTLRESDGKMLQEIIYLVDNGTKRPVVTKSIEYDAYGNQSVITDAASNTTHLTYDEQYHIFPVMIEKNVTLYDEEEIPRTETIFSYKLYNSDGTLKTEVDNDGYVVEYEYDALQTEIKKILPDETDVTVDVVDDLTSDPWLTSRQDNTSIDLTVDYQNESLITYGEDFEGGRLKSGIVKDGLGNTLEQIVYENAASDVIYSVKRMTYDSRGNMIALTDADAGDEYYTRTVMGTEVAVHDKTWLVWYDDLGREVKVEYPDKGNKVIKKTISYNDRDYIVTTTNTNGGQSIAHQDFAGNIINLTRVLDDEQQQTYYFQFNQVNQRIAFTDPKGETVRYLYDERGLMREQDYGNGRDIVTYDNRGNLIKKIDRKQQVIQLYYDELNRCYKQEYYHNDTEPAPYETKLYNYDGRGNLTLVKGLRMREQMEYDSRKRVIGLTRNYLDYDLRKALMDNVEWITVDTTDDQDFNFTYAYTPNNMQSALTLPNGKKIAYEYNTDKLLLKSIKTGLNDVTVDVISGVEYTLSGQVKALDYGNGNRQEWTFDDRKRISSIFAYNTQTNRELLDLKYMVDGENNITAINENTFAYDSFNRLIKSNILHLDATADYRKIVWAAYGTSLVEPYVGSAIYDVSADLMQDGVIDYHDHIIACQQWADEYDREQFSYDMNGNRTHLVQNGVFYDYQYGERNKLLEIKRDGKVLIDFAYDANGNTIAKTEHHGDGTSTLFEYEYDINNRLTRVIKDGVLHTRYMYDNEGMRLYKEENNKRTYYFRTGGAVNYEIEIDTGIEVVENSYIMSGELIAGRITSINDATEDAYYYHLDHLNSTKQVTDEAGEKVITYEYRAFGTHLDKVDKAGDETDDVARYSYIGREFDEEINLYYFNARFYDATLGRFINVDPIQDGQNWYVYCNNNPLSFIDPTGLSDDQVIPDNGTEDRSIPDEAEVMSKIKSAAIQQAKDIWAKIKGMSPHAAAQAASTTAPAGGEADTPALDTAYKPGFDFDAGLDGLSISYSDGTDRVGLSLSPTYDYSTDPTLSGSLGVDLTLKLETEGVFELDITAEGANVTLEAELPLDIVDVDVNAPGLRIDASLGGAINDSWTLQSTMTRSYNFQEKTSSLSGSISSTYSPLNLSLGFTGTYDFNNRSNRSFMFTVGREF